MKTSARTEFRVAGSHACGACPWRLANQGVPHPGGWYTKANLRRLWNGLRRGVRMSCHPTDPDMTWSDCSCHEPPPPGTATRECAGALILIQREMAHLQVVLEAGGSFADYQREHPMGLTKRGAATHANAMLFGGVPFVGGGLQMAQPDLDDDGVGYPPLGEWIRL